MLLIIGINHISAVLCMNKKAHLLFERSLSLKNNCIDFAKTVLSKP